MVHLYYLFRFCAIAYCFLFISACETSQKRQHDVTKANFKSLEVSVNGKVYHGVGVIPRSEKYEILIRPSSSSKRVVLHSCHIDKVLDPEEIKDRKSFWKKGIKFKYKPQKRVEDKQGCLLRITAMSHEEKPYDYAAFDFLDTRPHVSLPATVLCNGDTRLYDKGASICQAGVDTFQAIILPEVSNFTAWDESTKKEVSNGPCFNAVESRDGKFFEISVVPNECVYYFTSTKKCGDKYCQHRFTMFGVTDHPFREE